MNVYFFDPSHIKPEFFPYIYEALNVKSVYILTKDLEPSIRSFCQKDCQYVLNFNSNLHTEEGKALGNYAIFNFVDKMLCRNDLDNLYESSSNEPYVNLKNEKLNDPNLMVIIPPMPYFNKNYIYTPCDTFAQHFAQYSLNILRKKLDDRFAERIAFILIDSYFGKPRFYKRKNITNSQGIPKALVVTYFYKWKYLLSSFIIKQILKTHMDFKDADIDDIPYYVEKIVKVQDYQDLQETLESLEDARSEERHVGKECRSRWSPYH